MKKPSLKQAQAQRTTEKYGYVFHVLIICIIFCLELNASETSKPLYSIAAIVNQEVVSHQDVENRLRFLELTSGQEIPQQWRQKIYQNILSSLIDEAVQRQWTKKIGIRVTPQEIQQRLSHIEKQNNMSKGGLSTLLRTKNIPIETVIQQLRAVIAWEQYIQSKYATRIVISPQQIKRAMQHWERDRNQPFWYRGVEIVLNDNKSGREKAKLAQNIYHWLQEGTEFAQLVQSFSESPSKMQEGHTEWHNLQSLPLALQTFLKNAEPGTISKPFYVPTSKESGQWVVVLFLEKVDPRTLSIAQPTETEIKNGLSIARLDAYGQRELAVLKQMMYLEMPSEQDKSDKLKMQ